VTYMRYEASLMGNIEQALQGLLGYEEQAAEAGPTRFGETLADVDLIMEEPTTGERAFVQVKSKATQAILDDYLDRFRVSGYDRFFFVCHSTKGTLRLPDEAHLHLFEGKRLADAAVKNGLFDWLMERSG